MWPRESFHIGSMTTGLIAHSRMAKAKANSLALLHIWTAFIQFDLQQWKWYRMTWLNAASRKRYTFQINTSPTDTCETFTCVTPSWDARTEQGYCSPAGWWLVSVWTQWGLWSRTAIRSTWTHQQGSCRTCERGVCVCRGPRGVGVCSGQVC